MPITTCHTPDTNTRGSNARCDELFAQKALQVRQTFGFDGCFSFFRVHIRRIDCNVWFWFRSSKNPFWNCHNRWSFGPRESQNNGLDAMPIRSTWNQFKIIYRAAISVTQAIKCWARFCHFPSKLLAFAPIFPCIIHVIAWMKCVCVFELALHHIWRSLYELWCRHIWLILISLSIDRLEIINHVLQPFNGALDIPQTFSHCYGGISTVEQNKTKHIEDRYHRRCFPSDSDWNKSTIGDLVTLSVTNTLENTGWQKRDTTKRKRHNIDSIFDLKIVNSHHFRSHDHTCAVIHLSVGIGVRLLNQRWLIRFFLSVATTISIIEVLCNAFTSKIIENKTQPPHVTSDWTITVNQIVFHSLVNIAQYWRSLASIRTEHSIMLQWNAMILQWWQNDKC